MCVLSVYFRLDILCVNWDLDHSVVLLLDFVALGLVSLVLAKRLAVKNVSEMAYYCGSGNKTSK